MIELDFTSCQGQPELFKDAYNANHLQTLYTDHPWEALLPTRAPWQGLPCNLRNVCLRLPLDRGIPFVLEQLSRLERLNLVHAGDGPMHLDRPLDPFLNMRGLIFLTLGRAMHLPVQGVGLWTPAALRLLGMADRCILQMQRACSGRSIRFHY